MPLNEVLASNRVSQSKAPSVRFNRTTVPFDVPTKTELLKTAGEENPLAFDVFQRIWPVTASSATVQPIVEGEGILFPRDRKSTRLNSSHSQISYAVFC